ncbi:hypothetical protein Ancab_033039 [Ancistrocladus abbreviatus]
MVEVYKLVLEMLIPFTSIVKRLDVFRISASRTANSQPRKPLNSPWYFQEPLFLKWKEWGCRSDCRYHCMLAREQEKQKLGNKPVKYHGKWPFQRVLEIQVILIFSK